MRIYVAGHRGMAGSAIVRRLRAAGYDDIVIRSRDELDLTNQRAVFEFLTRERPDYVFLAAAKVGGIHANASRPAEFLYQNLAIEANLVHGAWRAGVQRMLFLGSSCIYPRDCPQPIRERYLLGGALEATNEPYAIAKIAGLKLCEAYNRQYGTRYSVVMPTNLYGPNDNYDLETSHVAAALLRKAHEAKLARAEELVVWGTGAPRREFLHVDDLADACVFLMERGYDGPLLNVGTGEDLPIRDLAALIMRVVGLEARLRFDTTKPDGTPRKLLDVGRLHALGWRARIPLADGLYDTYAHFKAACSRITPSATATT
jgi:GDP-L-fucose synthase